MISGYISSSTQFTRVQFTRVLSTLVLVPRRRRECKSMEHKSCIEGEIRRRISTLDGYFGLRMEKKLWIFQCFGGVTGYNVLN